MLGGDARCVGAIWSRSGSADGWKAALEQMRAELARFKEEHDQIRQLTKVLDKDLAEVEAGVKRLKERMDVVEPQETEDFHKIRFLEERIIKLELSRKKQDPVMDIFDH